MGMRKTGCTIALIPFALGILTDTAMAQRVKHHPWMARHVEQQPEAAPIEIQKPVTVVVAAPTVQKKQIQPIAEKKADRGDQIAKKALDYRGTRYKFGGTSKKGMDCSGLVARVYEDLKMHRVPRVSAELYHSGRPVHLAELRPGDLVFFKNTYKHGVSHVGVYTGNNKFVHAANKKHGVTVTSLADPYYQIHFAGARRLY
jgi:cell wall-associated NlpC family hydrolase